MKETLKIHMPNSIVAIIFTLLTCTLFSQDTILEDRSIVHALNDPINSKYYELAIENSPSNVIYQGMTNYIVPLFKNDDGLPIRSYCSGCIIKKEPLDIYNHDYVPDSLNGYYVYAGGRNEKATVAFAVHLGDSVIPIWRKEYKVVRLPNPDLYWGRSRSGRKLDSKSRALNVKYSEGVARKEAFTIVSWTINYGGQHIEGEGNDLSSAESLLKQLEPGTTLTIHAMVKGPDGIARQLTGVWII